MVMLRKNLQQVQQTELGGSNMPATVRRLTRSRPGRMTMIDYSLIAVVTTYGVLQVLLVLCGKAASL